MRKNNVARLVGVGAGAAALFLGTVVSPALASEQDPSAIEVIETVAPEVLHDLASPIELRGAEQSANPIESGVNGASVEIPQNPADPLVLQNDLHSEFAVTLPIDSEILEIATSNGLPIYSAGANAELIPAVKDDGSVQVTTVIGGSDSPTRYDFTFSAESSLQLTEDGFVIISDENGEYSGAVTPPWALDSTGETVPTHFEVVGNVLTQVVDHEGYAYPVVADPYMGKALISSVGVGSENGKPRYSVTKTTWGQTVAVGYGLGPQEDPLLGAHIMRNEGWKEAVSKGLSTATTIRQQYDCHTVYAAGKNPWNLERWRGTNDWWGVNPQLCNWNW